MTVVKKEGLILWGDENISLAAYIFLGVGKRGRVQSLHGRENLFIRNKGFRIADQPQAFLAFEDIAGTLTLGGCGIGEYYASTNDNLDAALEHAAGENKLIVFFSHGISVNPGPVDTGVDMLRHLLQKASEMGMRLVSMDELP